MNDIKLGTPHYCTIDKQYLLQIYTEDELIQNKYDHRPFIYFDDSNLLIAFPERTYKLQKKNNLNYYFDDNQHFIAVQNMIYVPEKYRKPYFINIDFQIKLLEIEKNKNIIIEKMKKTFMLMKTNAKFKNSHLDLIKSEQACNKFNKKEKYLLKIRRVSWIPANFSCIFQ